MSIKTTSRISRITTLLHNIQARIMLTPARSAVELTRCLLPALFVLGAMLHAPAVPAAGKSGAAVQFVPYIIDNEFVGACEVSVADMDGDGDLDMAGVGMEGDVIAWWENDGSERFTRQIIDGSVGGWPRSVRVKDEEGNLLDLDEDGDVDVLAACYLADRVYWYENDGSFGFTKHEVGVIDGAHTAVARDVDRDGRLDVVCSGYPLVWFENDGSENFTAHNLTVDTDLGQNVRALDLDGDGDIDFLEARNGEIGPRIWWNDGSEQFTAEVIDPDFDRCHFVEQHDVDGDGDQDYLGASMMPGHFAWWERGSGGSLTRHSIDTEMRGSCWISLADFDGDGDRDLAGTTFGFGAAAWWENDGEMNYTRHTLDGSVDGFCLVAEDLDNDGRTDLVGAWHGNDSIVWLRNVPHTGGRIIAGPGPGPDNSPLVRIFPPVDQVLQENEFSAYGAPHYGVNVSVGDLTGDGLDEILTGPGPGPMYGPHVRAFDGSGTPLGGVSFLAYGTPRWGVNVAAGDIDGDGYDEIVTGAGPGAVFGPHVRAFDADGGSGVGPVPGVSFFAYGTHRWGVKVAAGDIDGDGHDEIVTGAGPGAVFGPHVRAWNVDGGTAAAIPGVSFLAYGTNRNGVNVSCGDVDGDGIDEIVTGAGPGAMFGPHVRGWNVDGGTAAPMPGLSFFAWPPEERSYGVTVFSGRDLTGDGRDEIITGLGPDSANRGFVRIWRYRDNGVEQLYDIIAFSAPYTAGANVAAGRF